jgi:hypothetical protein
MKLKDYPPWRKCLVTLPLKRFRKKAGCINSPKKGLSLDWELMDENQ